MSAPRLAGLDNEAAQRVVAAAQALALGRADQATAQLRPALAAYPNHPEVLRLHAGVLNMRGEFPAALKTMQRAVELRPHDSLYLNTLGAIQGDGGDPDSAIETLQRACKLEPSLAIAWFNLGTMLVRCVRNEEAVEALRRAVTLDPNHMEARALLADMLRVGGRVQESAAEYRKVLAERPWAGMAWWGLADLRINAFAPEDVERMRTALRDSRATDDDRIAIGFALAKALDEQGRYDDSLDALKQANAIARLRQRWNAEAFSGTISVINDAFTPPPTPASPSDLGHEILFIVGMARSGTTLAEQILASHSQVEGTGELPDLSAVLAEESRRQGNPFPRWVDTMFPDDWRRLGERYLTRTAHWRRRRPRFTDKLPNNWMYIGAIRAMLPGAHVVVCRRDPLETCFSCYRQHLAGNEYTRTPEDLVSFWRDFDRTADHWARMYPAHVYQHDYEALQADPEQTIRKLLDFCGLPFEEACFHFHENTRTVRSPSATQVRRPLGSNTARGPQYGALLDPFRELLGLPLSGD
ncbi:MAG TPA: sulfotransferase [Rhodanobacter sp.]|jgi:tetratricopeptide (TPR) repeat protein|nr:sulfotransferase [Rhodanobacter sp.]